MNKISLCYLCFILVSFLASCSETQNDNITDDLQQLIKVGYSVKELSIRSDYSEEELIQAYSSTENVLTDSIKNSRIANIRSLHDSEQICPINRTNISAYDAIWQIYTKAQNLPRTSLYTGIGVSKVACALMKRRPLTGDDSIRALVGYVNMEYNLDEMPASIDRYYSKTSSLKDVVVPVSFRPNLSDEAKLKIDYYIYQNEQFELRANENLIKSLENKVDSQVSDAIDSFIEDDISSIFNTAKTYLMDSLEAKKFYEDKLSARLDLESLNKAILDEIITYCVSVNCSRAILINEVLNYNDDNNVLKISDRKSIESHITELENVSSLLEKQKKNLGVDVGAFVISLPLTYITKGAINQANVTFSIQAIKVFIVETLMFSGIDSIFKDLFNSKEDEIKISDLKSNLQNNLKMDLNQKINESIKGSNSYFENLNENTKKYYQQIRDYFNIK